MFDWDKDFEAEVQPRAITVVPPTVPRKPDVLAAQPAPNRHARHLKKLLPVAVLVGLGGASWATVDLRSGTKVAVSLAAFGGAFSATSATGDIRGVAEPALPHLQVYGPVQIVSFRSGIARFSTDDLYLHHDRTVRQLGTAVGPLAPYVADTLALIRHEMRIRGLVDHHLPQTASSAGGVSAPQAAFSDG